MVNTLYSSSMEPVLFLDIIWEFVERQFLRLHPELRIYIWMFEIKSLEIKSRLFPCCLQILPSYASCGLQWRTGLNMKYSNVSVHKCFCGWTVWFVNEHVQQYFFFLWLTPHPLRNTTTAVLLLWCEVLASSRWDLFADRPVHTCVVFCALYGTHGPVQCGSKESPEQAMVVKRKCRVVMKVTRMCRAGMKVTTRSEQKW